MSWPSVITMTLIDVLILAACGYGFWHNHRHRKRLGVGRLRLGDTLVEFGLVVVFLFFSADFLSMHALPAFLSADNALAITRNIRTEHVWYFALFGVGFIVSGFTMIIANVTTLVEESEHRRNSVSRRRRGRRRLGLGDG
jgi:hypothetical protein